MKTKALAIVVLPNGQPQKISLGVEVDELGGIYYPDYISINQLPYKRSSETMGEGKQAMPIYKKPDVSKGEDHWEGGVVQNNDTEFDDEGKVVADQEKYNR